MDIWGPSLISTLNEFIYFVIFVDDYLFFMKERSELLHIFSTFSTFYNFIKNGRWFCPPTRSEELVEIQHMLFDVQVGNEVRVIWLPSPNQLYSYKAT